jgi:transposase InsO family protein
VTRSGYYRWLRRHEAPRAVEDRALGPRIIAAHRASRGIYGAPRIVQQLRATGTRISRRRCARLMRTHGLRGKKRPRRGICTTLSAHKHPMAPNLLLGSWRPTAPNQLWVCDVTAIRTRAGWLFVAAVLDAFSRRIVSWACGPSNHSGLTLRALKRALLDRRPAPGLIHHSDRGSAYAEQTYVAALEAAGVRRSMSRPGNCYDNAIMESFWSSLKTETELDYRVLLTLKDAELLVFDYIESFYNRTRRHSSLGYLSPVAFETTIN